MKSMQRVLMVSAVAALFGCGAEVAPETSQSSVAKQAVTVIDCGSQLAQCTLAARGLSQLGQCTTAFTDCNTQAAQDLLDTQDLLADCRTESQACLRGALSLTDIRACRTTFDACSADAIDAAEQVVGDAVTSAQDAIDDAAQAAIDIINQTTDAAGDALDLVGACQGAATDCLTQADNVQDVLACQHVFEQCASDAVDLASTVLPELPGPTPAEIVAAVGECTDSSDECLAGALTLSDIRACRTTLNDCLDAASGLVDSTVNGLPTPTEVLDCNVALTQCLLTSLNAGQCINDANQCLGL